MYFKALVLKFVPLLETKKYAVWKENGCVFMGIRRFCGPASIFFFVLIKCSLQREHNAAWRIRERKADRWPL